MCHDQKQSSAPVYHPPEFIKDGWYHFLEVPGPDGYVKPSGPFLCEVDAVADQLEFMRSRGTAASHAR